MPGLATERGASPPPPLPSVRELYDEHAEFLWRTVRRLGVPEADVEDATQEVFVVIHRRLAEFEGRSSLRTWLFEIARRVAADWRQRAHVRRETTIEEAPERTTSGDVATELIARKQARAQLDLALAELDQEKREVFVLFELEQLPMQAVADAVGCPLQTAYARLYAARRVIEAWVSRQQEAHRS
ncbi:MAG: sigma-70 family RNA polymerase sigma factor [Myxococcaceae bacterium]|nr:sigma-70 family RNA polymerase sigma factor [Myxococcaceae bacterium]